jgi:hypothetical protein
MSVSETCDGSLGEPGERAGIPTFLPTARCPVCGYFVEIHPMEPSTSADVWRLEMHDRSGRTVHVGPSTNPLADCLMPDACVQCGSHSVSVRPESEDIEATCEKCRHGWRTGHLNESAGAI